LQIDLLVAGKLRGAVYTFECAGDAIPMHRHTDADAHVTIVARESVRVHGPEIGDKVYRAGAVIDFSAGVDHEIVGMVAGARVVSIIKN
jgi:hypothetical protein